MGGWWFEDEYGQFLIGVGGGGLTALIEEAQRLQLPNLRNLIENGFVEAEDVPQLMIECNQSDVARDLLEAFGKVPPDSGIGITNIVRPGDEAE